MVRCPNCQHESTGSFFCERCHHLLPVTFQPSVPESVTLPDGQVVDCSSWAGIWPADASTPRAAAWGDRPCRVYAINRTWWLDLSARIARRADVVLDVLPPLAIIPVGGSAIVVAGGLPGARAVLLDGEPHDADVFSCLDGTLAACRLLEKALRPLHAAGMVWLDFDPAGLDAAGEQVALRALDLQLFPAGEGPSNPRLHRAYSSPEVCACHGEAIGPATDVFHVSLYAYYRLAGLLPHGCPGKGLQTFDFALPELRIYRPDLPPGIACILQRGLMQDPSARFASITELCDELHDAIDRARRRQTSLAPIRIQCGAGSIIGAMHEHLGMPNQDRYTLASLDPGVLFGIVADGVSHARVGSGDQASQIALDMLATRLPERLGPSGSEGSIGELLTEVYFKTSSAILAEALADPAAFNGMEPVDFMSTTALVGLVRGNELTLSAVGDSRAYLVAEGIAEQLTVDGDVRCANLARGLPPEQAALLGDEGFALCTCLGVGERGPDGGIIASRERSRPGITRCTLLPGDVVILCSDGLAEEGVFLGARDLVRIAVESRGDPVEMLVERLIQAAGACHRPPSPGEPHGSGDDITCVVLVVE